MSGLVLTLNAGSSSLKFALFEAASGVPALRASGQVEGIGSAPRFVARDAAGAQLQESFWEPVAGGRGHAVAFEQIWSWLTRYTTGEHIAAVGHRVAHGGPDFVEPVLIDDQVLEALERLVPLVPLHQPHNLAGVRAVTASRPDLPQVACFDTSFHRGRELVTDHFGLPFELYESGIRRYGFHGTSYEYIAGKLGEVAPQIAEGRVVIAHLGSGSSMCAIHQGRSVDTTMSFSALDGLPMGTRCGSLDPGVLLYLMREEGMSREDLDELLYKRSGLLGISGVSNDLRRLSESDDPGAARAIDYLVHRIAQELGALTASLGGLDALVFTAGIGENSPLIRARVCEASRWLGIRLDAAANERGETCISTADARPSVWVVPTNEERMMAVHTLRLVGASG